MKVRNEQISQNRFDSAELKIIVVSDDRRGGGQSRRLGTGRIRRRGGYNALLQIGVGAGKARKLKASRQPPFSIGIRSGCCRFHAPPAGMQSDRARFSAERFSARAR